MQQVQSEQDKMVPIDTSGESVEIELKSAPQFNITSDVSPITCFGANDGSIKLKSVINCLYVFLSEKAMYRIFNMLKNYLQSRSYVDIILPY